MGRGLPAFNRNLDYDSRVQARAEYYIAAPSRQFNFDFKNRYWMQYDLAKNYVSSEEQGGAYEGATYGLGNALAGIGFMHAVISVYLCYLFLRPLRNADRPDPAMRAQMRRVLIASTVAVFSTLVCYGGIGRFAHPCLLLAVDSIINDLCLAILVLTDEEGSAARDASGLRVGVAVSLDDSPGLELSDGAVLS